MAPLTEGKHTGEFLLTEARGKISRDTVTVTVPASTTLAPGQVLGALAANNKHVPFDELDTDGREVAVAILYAEQENATGAPVDVQAAVFNWSCEVRAADLVWGTADSAVGTPQLASLGVKAR